MQQGTDCPAQPSDNPDLSLQTQSDLLSTKQPLTAMGLKTKGRAPNHSKCEELEHSSTCTLALGQKGGGLSFYYSTIQKHVTIEALCIAI